MAYLQTYDTLESIESSMGEEVDHSFDKCSQDTELEQPSDSSVELDPATRTSTSIDPNVFPILQLPREIRDLIYTLCQDLEEDSAVENSQWFVDEFEYNQDHSTSGRFAPWKGYHRDARANKRFNGGYVFYVDRNASQIGSKLWALNRQIRAEAMSVHLERNLVLESSVHDGMYHPPTILERWMNIMTTEQLSTISRVHLHSKCALVARGEFGKEIMAKSITPWSLGGDDCLCRHKAIHSSFDSSDAIFRIELDPAKQTLSIRTFCTLTWWQETLIYDTVQDWASTLVKGQRFTGQQILRVVQILQALEEEMYTTELNRRVHACLGQDWDSPNLFRQFGWMMEATEQNMEVLEVEPNNVVDQSVLHTNGAEQHAIANGTCNRNVPKPETHKTAEIQISDDANDQAWEEKSNSIYLLKNGWDALHIAKSKTSRREVLYKHVVVEVYAGGHH